MSHSWLLFGHCGTEVLLRKIMWSLQDDDSLFRSFVTIKPAAEKILSDGTDVDGTAKYRRARTESLEYLSELSFHHARESVTGILQFSSHYIVWKTSKLYMYEVAFSQPYLSKFNSNKLLIVQYFKFELCSYQFLNLQASVLPGGNKQIRDQLPFNWPIIVM